MTAITLSKNQQKVFNGLNPFVQDLLSQRLAGFDAPADPETIRLLITIIEYSGPKEDFCAVVARSSNDIVNQSLKQLLFVIQQGMGEIFFECASTHKEQYYTISTLAEMIDLFHRLAPHFVKDHPPLRRFPPYDYGGRELLLQLEKNPSNLMRLLQKEEPKCILNGGLAGYRHLFLLDESKRLSIETYEVIFRALDELRLTDIEKNGVKSLLMEMTTNKNGVLVNRYSVEYLKIFLDIIQKVHDFCGEEPLIHFCYAPDLRNAPSLDGVVCSLQCILAWYESSSNLDELTRLLHSFYRNELKFTHLLSNLSVHISTPKISLADEPDVLEVLYKRFAGEIIDPSVVFPLPLDILIKVREQYGVVQNYCKKWESLRLEELVSISVEIAAKVDKSLDDSLKLVAIGRLAILHEFRIYLHNTQIWVVLAQLNFSKGCVSQMLTGEGKSKTATLLAFVLVMRSSTQGHMISSSALLSIRDQEEHSKFFKIFGVTTAHICENDCDASRFQARILYGTATDFEFAVMREMLYYQKLFPSQAFDWVIVDEIDNLTIDTALSGARLSHSAEITYDWVYVPIFSFVQSRFPFDFPTDEMVDALRVYLKEYMSGKFSQFLDCFSDKKLENWINSACRALRLKEKEDYVIGLHDSALGAKNRRVLIVDADNTGKINYGSRWTGGVHEFVEVKHGLDLERESICPISMSHPVFYPMYKSLYGITGTIGSEFERSELKAIYSIDSFDVPTHRPSRREDAAAVVLATSALCGEYYLNTILRCVQAGRPILVLCSSIKETEILEKQLQNAQVPFEILNEIQRNTEGEIISRAGLPGAVTIATNIAGRGTDIKLTEESIRNGGLHVLITFDPRSDRVELQARGRSGRQGQPGSSEIVISSENFDMDPEQVLSFLKSSRQQRTISQKDTHIAHAHLERSMFEMVREFYRMLKAFHEFANREPFLNSCSAFLSKRKFLKPEVRDFSHLSLKNQRVGEMVLQLLNSPQDMTIEWKILLQQLVKRVEDHVINDFALNFHPLLAEVIQDSGLMSDLASANLFRAMSDQAVQISDGDFLVRIEAALRASSAAKIATAQKELQATFIQRKGIWEDYLDLSDRGILRYMKDQFKIDLKVRKSKIK